MTIITSAQLSALRKPKPSKAETRANKKRLLAERVKVWSDPARWEGGYKDEGDGIYWKSGIKPQWLVIRMPRPPGANQRQTPLLIGRRAMMIETAPAQAWKKIAVDMFRRFSLPSFGAQGVVCWWISYRGGVGPDASNTVKIAEDAICQQVDKKRVIWRGVIDSDKQVWPLLISRGDAPANGEPMLELRIAPWPATELLAAQHAYDTAWTARQHADQTRQGIMFDGK